jgi:serine phosphatase RsbU (regulator of sigma subunit)
VKFVETLTTPPRLFLDAGHLRAGVASLRQRFPDLSVAVLLPGKDGGHSLLLHLDAPGPDANRAAASVAVRRLGPLLAEQHCTLLPAPFPVDADFAALFPGATSVFLRRAWSTSGEELLIAIAVDGIDAEFAGQHGTSLLTDRLRYRFDEYLLQSQITAVTRMLEEQLNEVKTVKEKLLPAADHRVHGANYAVHYRPGAGGGGDYYEIADLRESRREMGYEGSGDLWGAIIGDVSGHGPGAAVEVAMLDAILRTFEASPDFHPGHLLTYLNRHMFTRQIRGGFVTSFQIIYDGAEGALGFASAGHPAAVHKFADRARGARLLDCGGDIPLGIEREHEWSSETTRFGRNDMLVLYTDGASEARSHDGREFGIEGLRKVVADSAAEKPADLLADITTALDRHTGVSPAMDDCTIVVVQPSG